MERKPIRLFLVTGFLGSGKTSFLQYALTQVKDTKVGVIVNEFGQIGIDGKVLQSGDLKLVEINDGSIFCSCLKSGFVRTLAAFLEQPVDLLFVEASGMADPSNMRQLLDYLNAVLSKKPEVSRRYDYRGSICILDAKRFMAYYDMFPAIEAQIRQSEFIVLNKMDEVDAETADAHLKWLGEIRPDAAVIPAEYGEVPSGLPGPCNGTSGSRPDQITGDTAFFLHCGYIRRLYREQIRGLCTALADSTLRVKGFFRTKDGYGRADCVCDFISVEPLDEGITVKPGDLKLVIISREDNGIEEKVKELLQKAALE